MDRVFNCDDLLLNYLMASTLQGMNDVHSPLGASVCPSIVLRVGSCAGMSSQSVW